jgi:hypothetical protein
MRLRTVALASALALPAALGLVPGAPMLAPTEAAAAVSVLMSLDELTAVSTYVVVAKAVDRTSVWEELGGGRRIVTYTRLHVEQSVVGAPGTELVVRTLGGAVDHIGQSVSGEAQLPIGSRSLLFVAQGEGALVVSGMAQGHYPIIERDKEPLRLGPSPDAGALLPRRGPTISAREVLLGATLESAIGAIQRSRKAQDGRK